MYHIHRLNVHELFPKFLKVFNKGTAKPAYQLTPYAESSGSRLYRNVKLRLERDKGSMYWRVHEACEPQVSKVDHLVASMQGAVTHARIKI